MNTKPKELNQLNHYISYFQSVITIGILNVAEIEQEASKRAFEKLTNKDGVNHCFFDQTNFELEKTEQWKPEFSSEALGEINGDMIFNINLSPETKSIIATRLQKDVEELTDADYANFLKESVQQSLDQE